MNVAIYIRVSTKKQELSRDGQIADLRAYCQQRGHSIVGEYVDFGISGAKSSRPQLDRLMSDAMHHVFEAVIVYKLDRFGRSLSHLVTTIEKLDSNKIVFISVRDSIDLSTPAGRLMFHMLAAIAEFERDLILDRVNVGVDRCKTTGITKTGRWFGRERKFNRDAMVIYSDTHTIRETAVAFGVSRQAIEKARKLCQG